MITIGLIGGGERRCAAREFALLFSGRQTGQLTKSREKDSNVLEKILLYFTVSASFDSRIALGLGRRDRVRRGATSVALLSNSCVEISTVTLASSAPRSRSVVVALVGFRNRRCLLFCCSCRFRSSWLPSCKCWRWNLQQCNQPRRYRRQHMYPCDCLEAWH